MANVPLHYSDDQVEITKVVVGPMDNNVFYARCRETGETLMVDAANEAQKLLDLCRELGVTTVVETLTHWDHIQAVPQVREAGYPVGVTAADAPRLDDYDFLIEDEQVLEVGKLRLTAMHTPGHTPGSVCFKIEGSPVLFSGDTLFPGGPGATKYPGGDFPTIIESVKRLFTLPSETVVMPGHGADTTVGDEQPHLQEWIDRGW